MSILNDTNEKFECNTKNRTILSLYLSFIHLHLDSSEVAVKFQNIDIFYAGARGLSAMHHVFLLRVRQKQPTIS